MPSIKSVFIDYLDANNLWINKSNGVSKCILITDLIAHDERFKNGNGGGWCRSDGPLKDYVIDRKKDNGTRITSIQLQGIRPNVVQRKIQSVISKAITSKRCAVLDIGTNIECDHKNGRYNSNAMLNTSGQVITDFQPLSKAVNMAKRTHCKNCKDTHKRFDARRLGYPVGWLYGGNENYNNTCIGCYWYDPQGFNQAMADTTSPDYIQPLLQSPPKNKP